MHTEVLAPGRVAVITGAGSGIGAALAHTLVRRGLRVAIADIDAHRVESVAEDLARDGADVLAVVTDVSDCASVEALARKVQAHWGPTNLLVNDAGIETTGKLWEIPPDRWDGAIGVNLSGIYYGIHAFVPGMIAAEEPAHVVNMASVGSLGIAAFQAPYIVSKHAVLALTESLWEEFKADNIGIGVSAVLPGPVSTAIFTDATSADEDGLGAKHRDDMRAFLANEGISPAEVADRIVEGIAGNELWIHTHPELSDAAIQFRMNALLSRNPGAVRERW